MMRIPIKVGIACLAIGAVACLGWVLMPHRTKALQVNASKPDVRLDEIQKSPQSFIAKNENSKDVKVQTLVTRARMTEAYKAANRKDYTTARAEFVEAAYKHKGTDAMDPAFGTQSDQAAYQAIVCLDASGKKDEAQHEYRQFIKDRPLSPLIHACARRLERLNHNVLSQNDQALLESGIAAQEKKIQFETSVCGPKCLEAILPLLGQPAKDYKELAKICSTTDKGTSLEGMKKGCETLGLKPIGLDLNAKDLAAMNKPFLWLQSDHYLAVLEIKGGKAHIFDPRFKTDDWRKLPDIDDAKFRATVLAFELPSADLEADTHKPVTEKAISKGSATK